MNCPWAKKASAWRTKRKRVTRVEAGNCPWKSIISVIGTNPHACMDSDLKRRYNYWEMLNDGGKRKEEKRESQ